MKCCMTHAFQSLMFWKAVLDKSKENLYNIAFVNGECHKPVSHSSKDSKQRECQSLKKINYRSEETELK